MQADSLVDLGQGMSQVFEHCCEVAAGCLLATSDQDVVKAVPAMFGQYHAGHFTKPSFGTVAGYGISHFLRAGDSNANALRLLRAAVSDLENESGRAATHAGRGLEVVRPLLERDESAGLHDDQECKSEWSIPEDRFTTDGLFND